LCIEARRQQLGHQHIDVLTLLLDVGDESEDLEESFKLQKKRFSVIRMLFVSKLQSMKRGTSSEASRRSKKAFIYDSYSVCCPIIIWSVTEGQQAATCLGRLGYCDLWLQEIELFMNDAEKNNRAFFPKFVAPDASPPV